MEAFVQNRDRYRLAARVPSMRYRGVRQIDGPPLEIWVPVRR
jgi:hypothetical protein